MRGYACNDRPQPAFSETDMAPTAGNCEPDHRVVCRGIREAAGNKTDNRSLPGNRETVTSPREVLGLDPDTGDERGTIRGHSRRTAGTSAEKVIAAAVTGHFGKCSLSTTDTLTRSLFSWQVHV